jgi:nucleotide-binding universal stress UspA family protein
MKVLFGVDGSANGMAAVYFGGQLLSEQSDRITLYFSPPQLTFPAGQHADRATLDRLRNVLAEGVFDEAQRQLPVLLRETVQVIIGVQNPARGLLLAADEIRADLLVVGARGARSSDRVARIGSVAQSAAHHATIPVLVVRPRPHENADKPLRVLLASDSCEASKHAGEFLRNFTWPKGAIGHVLSVVESPIAGAMPEWVEDQLCQQEAEATGLDAIQRTPDQQSHLDESLRCCCGELPAIFEGQEPRVAVGSPSREIVHAIEKENVDLVVVGARGFGSVGRLLLGSTSEYLLTHAPCSVLIVRQHERP